MSKGKYSWLLLLLLPCIFIAWFFISKKENKPLRTLPYFGPKYAAKTSDTSYHTVQPFLFIDQYNNKVTEETVKGKVYVTDYFFTTCKSISS
jgi:protein SCO1